MVFCSTFRYSLGLTLSREHILNEAALLCLLLKRVVYVINQTSSIVFEVLGQEVGLALYLLTNPCLLLHATAF